MNELWENIKKRRTENIVLKQRLETCAKMIASCLKSNSPEKEKLELIKKIIRISSEVGDFRKTADVISSHALQYVSDRGRRLKNGDISLQSHMKNELRHEHLVPCSVLAKLIHTNQLQENMIYNALIENGIRAIITKEEDKKIDIIKLKSKMPDSWEFGCNPFARYSISQIHNLQIKPTNIAP